MIQSNIPPNITEQDIDAQFGDEPKTITLNAQQVELIKELMHEAIVEEWSKTTTAVAYQIINKLTE